MQQRKQEKRIQFVLVVIFLVIIVEIIVRYILLERTFYQGIDYDMLQQELRAMRIQNTELEDKVLLESSLTVIATKAAQMGLTKEATYYILR